MCAACAVCFRLQTTQAYVCAPIFDMRSAVWCFVIYQWLALESTLLILARSTPDLDAPLCIITVFWCGARGAVFRDTDNRISIISVKLEIVCI